MQRKQGQQEVSSDSYNFGLITFIQKQNDNETKMPLNFAHINFKLYCITETFHF